MRHVETYVVAGAAIVFAVLTAFGDRVSDELKMAALLAGVGLLVYNITVPKGEAFARLDDFLDDRSDFIPLKTRLEKAQSMWIYAPSAANILSADNTKTIQQTILSRPGGEFRVIIQDPDKTEEIAELKAQLDDRITFQIQDLPTEIQRTLDLLRRMKDWHTTGNFDFRLLATNPGFSLVVIDPDKRKGTVIVEFYGYTHDHTANRMHIEITPEQSERWFTYWVGQFNEMWEGAHEDNPEMEQTG
jgi:hypothetical protein